MSGTGVQEYEKRLLAKDSEVKHAQFALRRLKAELHSARSKLEDTSRMLPAPEPTLGKLATWLVADISALKLSVLLLVLGRWPLLCRWLMPAMCYGVLFLLKPLKEGV